MSSLSKPPILELDRVSYSYEEGRDFNNDISFISVRSLAVLLAMFASLPSDTVAVFVTLPEALPATFTLTVMAG